MTNRRLVHDGTVGGFGLNGERELCVAIAIRPRATSIKCIRIRNKTMFSNDN